MIINKQILLISILLVLHYSSCFGQKRIPSKSIISIENQHLIAKIDNPIRIVAQQNKPVSMNQLSATFQEYDSEKIPIEILAGNGYFIINPDTIGIVEINILIGDTMETKILRVKPIEAVGRLGRHKANVEEKISAGEFKSERGIIANVECCGFDARCQVLEFQTIRISNKNEIERTLNKGGKFDDKTRKIIKKAESRDIFVFRQIKYKCPGSGKFQRLDDMIFEIE